jgi:hypothetical protein
MFIADCASFDLKVRQERHPPYVAPDGAEENAPFAIYKHFAPLWLGFPNPLSAIPPPPSSFKKEICPEIVMGFSQSSRVRR